MKDPSPQHSPSLRHRRERSLLSRFRGGLLGALGAISCGGYSALTWWLDGSGEAESVISFLALMGALFALYFLVLGLFGRELRSRSEVRQVLLWAVLFRLILLPAGLAPGSWLEDLREDMSSQAVTYRTFLLYDNDVWRYLWDGHVASRLANPYAYTPAELEERADAGEAVAEELFADSLWFDIYDNVSYRHYRTVYPPLAQLLFRVHRAMFPGSVFFWKLALVLFDLGTCLVLGSLLARLGLPPGLVLVYAWNPLVVKEIAGSGHVDAMMIFFLTLSADLLLRGRRYAGLLAYGLAILSKLTPALVFLLYLKRTRPREWPILPLSVLAGFLPFLPSWLDMLDGIRAFAREWVFNPGPWALFKWLAELGGLPGRETASLVSLALTLALVVWVAARDDGSGAGLVHGIFVILCGYVVLSATVMPWYLLWALPFAAATTFRALTALTALSLLSYLIYIDQVERPWWLWTEFVIFFLVLLSRCRIKKLEES